MLRIAAVVIANCLPLSPATAQQVGDPIAGTAVASKACAECHEENYKSNRRSPHKKIECENCHGPAGPGSNHPDVVEKLPLNTSRALCLRCHADLGYPGTARAELPQIKDKQHKRRKDCIECHNPHDPREDVE